MIRTTTYWIRSQPISLAFVADTPGHPEAFAGTIVPPPPAPISPDLGTSPLDRSPRFTARNIRRALGKDPAYSQQLRDRVAFAATMHRILLVRAQGDFFTVPAMSGLP